MKTTIIVMRDKHIVHVNTENENVYKNPHTVILSNVELTNDEVLEASELSEADIEAYTSHKLIPTNDKGICRPDPKANSYSYYIFKTENNESK